MTNFERALYADPDGDLTATWWQLVHRYQGLTTGQTAGYQPVGGEDPRLPGAGLLPQLPVGAMVASQLRDALDRQAGGIVDRPEAARILIDRLFRAGESIRWDRLVERVTGSPLRAASLRLELAAPSS